MRFKDKVAVVTGGNSGIGLATAKAFAREGAKVAVTGRDAKSLEQAAKELGSQALAIRSDVSRLADIEAAAGQIKKTFGKVDALFVNAGIAKFSPWDQVNETFFDETFDINVKGAFFTVQKLVPLMSPSAAIVLNASVVSQKGMPATTVYAASKAAVRNMARTFSRELLAKGIRVNVVSPGPIDTPIFGRLGWDAAATEGTKAQLAASTPMGRMGQADEIAKAVLFLASADSAYIAGVELFVDGGLAEL